MKGVGREHDITEPLATSTMIQIVHRTALLLVDLVIFNNMPQNKINSKL